MAIIHFVRDAGENLIKRSKDGHVLGTDALQQRLRQMGLHIKDLDISIKDELATVTGEVRNLGEREKAIIIIGNVKGIARVKDCFSPGLEGGASPYFHTVVRGESLADIALQHYGDAEMIDQILVANYPVITQATVLYPGQKLRVPPLNDS